MRIGLISGEYPPRQGGVGAYSRILGLVLADAGHDLFVLSGRTAREDDARLTLDRLEHWGPGCWQGVETWARHRRLDVIDLQYQTAAYAMSPWIHFLPARVHSAPVAVTFHDLRFPYLFPKAGPLRPWIVRHLAQSATGVIATNSEDYARLSTHQHAALIPIGSNILAESAGFDRAASRRQAGAGAVDFLIVFFGLLNRSKGLDILISALAGLHANGIPAHLAVVGSAGSSDPTNQAYEAEVRAEVNTAGLTNAVTFTGFLPEADVAGLLRAADAVALPFLDGASYRRGSLMAALRSGCALVTTNPSVPAPPFRDGETMLLIPPGDAGALQGALSRLVADAALCDRLRAGAAEASALFAWPEIAADVVAFLQQIVEERAR